MTRDDRNNNSLIIEYQFFHHSHERTKINAKIVWSDHPNNHKDWLDEELQPFNSMGGLVLEIVATKDIKEGEEGKRTTKSIFVYYLLKDDIL